MLYAFEAEAASRAVLDGVNELTYPILSGADSIGMADILSNWRAEIVEPAAS